MLMALIPALGLLIFAVWDSSPQPARAAKAGAPRAGQVGSAKAPEPPPPPINSPQYDALVAELAGMGREAQRLFAAGKIAESGEVVTKGEALASKVLSVPRPTLAATEAAGDMDHLYGKILSANGKYGWARLQFQKNLVRWKYWQPQTDETARRMREARDAIAECDKHIKG